eukprot:CAMPEP_0114487358 /NCGR_PEP_ID=MMETSP0109-20121206/723_1 /TAXON_ID=29199 /ORGANISM="Chlorarachnion reptans, Strain CCCM449" /LENGTH=285 /DNA_ID=CAMNT_0001663617 /DNA_START=129 /DNA_END=986 /DNA_ORIENTATION=-
MMGAEYALFQRRTRRRVSRSILAAAISCLSFAVLALPSHLSATRTSTLSQRKAAPHNSGCTRIYERVGSPTNIYELHGGATKKEAKATKTEAKESKEPKSPKKKANSNGSTKRKDDKNEKESAKKKSKKAERDADKPKRPKSAFFLFVDKFREENRSKYDTKSLLVEAGNRWQKLSDSEKAPFEKQAAILKSAYEKEMEAYKLKQSKTKEGRKPKKSMTAFLYYMVYFRKQYEGKYSMTEMVQKGGESWKSLDAAEKKKYEKQAQDAKKAYEEEMKKWNEIPDDE